LDTNSQEQILEFSKQELAALKKLKSPEKIQLFLDEEIAYNKEPEGATCRSPRRVLRDRVGHCAEGAFFAAAALRIHGHEPLILDLEAVRDDDHLLAVFKQDNHWGAIAKSNYAGLRFREPIYRTIRELAMSYFEHYYNLKGEKTLRAFSTRPLNLKKFDRNFWMTSEDDLWEICEHLCTVPHARIMTLPMEVKRRMMDRRLYEAGKTGMAK
jgi:hypothetical protein